MAKGDCPVSRHSCALIDNFFYHWRMVQLLGTFFIIGLTGALSPGPLTTMAIVEGSRRGRWSGARLAIGHGLIESVYVAIIALVLWFGRDALLEQPVLAGFIALIGGLFLAWMGLGMAWGSYQHRLSLEGQAATRARFGLEPTGILITLSNPFWWIWWIVVSPLYIQRSFAWGIAGIALLYFFHWTSDLGWLTGISWLTGSGRKLISPAVYRWVLIICGAALVFFGVTFAIAGIGFWVTGKVSLG